MHPRIVTARVKERRMGGCRFNSISREIKQPAADVWWGREDVSLSSGGQINFVEEQSGFSRVSQACSAEKALDKSTRSDARGKAGRSKGEREGADLQQNEKKECVQRWNSI